MANSYAGMPFILDSTMPATYKNTAGVPNVLSLYPRTIYWYQPVTIGDTFVIADANGVTLFQGRCEVAAQSQYFQVPTGVKWQDWQLNTIASGKLFIYYST